MSYLDIFSDKTDPRRGVNFNLSVSQLVRGSVVFISDLVQKMWGLKCVECSDVSWAELSNLRVNSSESSESQAQRWAAPCPAWRRRPQRGAGRSTGSSPWTGRRPAGRWSSCCWGPGSPGRAPLWSRWRSSTRLATVRRSVSSTSQSSTATPSRVWWPSSEPWVSSG